MAQGGGGIWSEGSTVRLVHVTLSNNRADGGQAGNGGGIRSAGGTVFLRATILDTGAAGANCSAPVTSQGGNVADDTSCFANAGADRVVADAGLGALAVNAPGLTATHALQPGSPAIDAVPLPCTSEGPAGGAPVPTDQRGVARPQDGDGNGSALCDSGAFERAASEPAPPVPACEPRPRVIAQPAVGGGKLQVRIEPTPLNNQQVNRLVVLRFGTFQNARVTLNGQSVASGQTVTLPPGTLGVDFTVERATPGQATTVPLVVVDGCGDWPTFVGGGTAAGF
jgi:hypothetical protein